MSYNIVNKQQQTFTYQGFTVQNKKHIKNIGFDNKKNKEYGWVIKLKNKYN
jgi:hypothetical protein